jgi:hypothetical protein
MSEVYESQIMACLVPGRSMKEMCSLIAPLAKKKLLGEEPSLNITTADLAEWIMGTEMFHDPNFVIARKRLYTVLLLLAKGEMRNWRKHGTVPTRKMYGRESFPNIWFDAAYNSHPVIGVDPAARKPELPAMGRPQPPLPEIWPYADALIEAFGRGTIPLVEIVLRIAPLLLADIPPSAPVPFAHLVDCMIPRSVSSANKSLRDVIYGALGLLKECELKSFCTLTPTLTPEGKTFNKRSWHRAK